MNRLLMVVLNWNGAEDSLVCIESLQKQTFKSLDILIVDNNSSDDSVEKFKEILPNSTNIHLIENPVNSGFAGGINVGVNYALDHDYEYIGILNPDAKAEPNWIEEIIKAIESDKEAGIGTGLLLRMDGKTIDGAGDFYNTWGIPSPRLRDQPTSKAPKSAERVFGATGGGVIYKTEVFRTIGLFDENFFMYFEDIDISFRAQLAGFTVQFTPKAIAYHKQGASTNKVPGLAVYNTFKNLPMVFWKNVPVSLLPTIFPRFFLAHSLILINAILKGRGGPALKGFFKSLALIPHMARERRRIQSSKQVSDKYISSIILHDIPPEQTGLRKFRKVFTGK